MKFQKLEKQHLLRISQSIAIFGFLSILVLTMGIETIQFTKGTPLTPTSSRSPILPIGMGMQGNWWVNLFLVMVLGMFPLALILLIFSSEARRIFRKYMKALLIWFVFLISFRLYLLLAKDESNISTGGGDRPALPGVFDPPSIPTTEAVANPDIYSPPNVPPWLGYLVGFLLAFTLVLLVYYFWFRNKPEQDKLKEIALDAIRDINLGHQWEDIIIQCYARMNEVVRNRKQLDRRSFMTPAEFASELTAAGLPPAPVKKLTFLFEQARYGRGSNHKRDIEEAINCLTAITDSLNIAG